MGQLIVHGLFEQGIYRGQICNRPATGNGIVQGHLILAGGMVYDSLHHVDKSLPVLLLIQAEATIKKIR